MDIPRAFCLECGCDDFHACPEGCWWLRVDYEMGVGVCSECAPRVDDWDRGDRTSPSWLGTGAIAGDWGSDLGTTRDAP